MKTLIKTSGILLFAVLLITAVRIVHADNTSAQNFGDILNQAKDISNTGANQINNGSVTTGNATAGQDISNTINTSATGCNCTPTPSAQPTPSPTLGVTPTPTNTPGGGGDGGGNGNNNSSSGGGASSNSSPSTSGQVLGLSATGGTNQTLQALTLLGSLLSAAGGAFLLKKNA